MRLPTQILMEVPMATVGERVHVASRKLGQPPPRGRGYGRERFAAARQVVDR